MRDYTPTNFRNDKPECIRGREKTCTECNGVISDLCTEPCGEDHEIYEDGSTVTVVSGGKCMICAYPSSPLIRPHLQRL